MLSNTNDVDSLPLRSHSSEGINGHSGANSTYSPRSSAAEGDLLYEETKKGARECAIIADFMKKRAKIEDEYARSMLQLCKSFPSGSSGTAIGEIFSNLLECTAKQAGGYLAAASQITTEVNNPLKQFVDDLKSELKGVQQEAQKLAMEKREVCESYKRSKTAFESASKDNVDEAKLRELEEDYKVHIRHTNTYLQLVYSEKFHKIASELQKTEVLRMHKMKVSIKKFVSLLEDLPQQTAADFASLSEKINSLDTKEEIKSFSSLAKSLSHEEEIIFEPVERATSPPPKTKKEWRFTIRSSSVPNNMGIPLGLVGEKSPDKKPLQKLPPTAVFGVPIEVAMERQKTRFPDLLVPHVIVILIDLIKHLNGCKTEGIFRVPGVARETEALRRAFDLGEAVEAKLFPNIHTAASALKLWLRELPNSLIPEDIYSCLSCESNEAAYICFEAFPVLNRRILLIFLQFFKELLLVENVVRTRMDAENIAIVFTPSFMRCSSVPQTSLLDNVDKERNFIHRLLSSGDFLLSKYGHLLLQQARENGNWKSVRVPSVSPPNSSSYSLSSSSPPSTRPQLAAPLTRLASQKRLQQQETTTIMQ